ncbi:MAG: DUF4160 domain-containing protein [Gemmobacter sp.]
MIVVHRAYGFRFVIYTDDHEPAHLRILGHGGEVKVQIDPERGIKVMDVKRLPCSVVRRVLPEVSSNHAAFLLRWNEINGTRNRVR